MIQPFTDSGVSQRSSGPDSPAGSSRDFSRPSGTGDRRTLGSTRARTRGFPIDMPAPHKWPAGDTLPLARWKRRTGKDGTPRAPKQPA